MFSPLVGAIRVHCAMKVNSRDGFVSIEYIGNNLRIFVAGSTLIVDDNIITFSPVSVLKEIERWINGLVSSPKYINSYISPALHALGDNFVLLRVIVATTTSNEQSLEWFSCRSVWNETSLFGFVGLGASEWQGGEKSEAR